MLIKDDFLKLNQAQRNKLYAMKGNNWENIKVYLEDTDKRGSPGTKNNFGCMRIEFEINGIQYRTRVSKQNNGRKG